MEGGEEDIGEGRTQGPGILEVITSLVPIALDIGEKIYNLISGSSEKQDNNEVNRELENQISQINEQKKWRKDRKLIKNAKRKSGRNEKERNRKGKRIIRKWIKWKRKISIGIKKERRSH